MAAGEPARRPLDGPAVREWGERVLQRLRGCADELNQLNVFPVADGDTGSNLVATFAEVVSAAGEVPGAATAGAAGVLAAMARGALLGAHGNSGTIVSQLLRGLAAAAPDTGPLDGPALAAGLRLGAGLARRAVAAPVEGTVLSVADAAAAAAGRAGGNIDRVLSAAVDAAATAVALSTSQLAELAAAGVVDAGARGWWLVLETLRDLAAGRPADAVPPPLVPRGATPAAREIGSCDLAFEVQYLVDLVDLVDSVDSVDWRQPVEPNEVIELPATGAAALLRRRLGRVGDSVVVVEEGGLVNVHVHTDDVAAAVREGGRLGRVHRLTVTRFAAAQGGVS